MKRAMQEELRVVRTGLMLALLTLLFGFGLGMTFGAFEDSLKGYLKSEAEQVRETAYAGDEVLMKKITDKSWVYIKRAHFHANGLGVIAVSLILLILFIPMADKIKALTSFSLGFGSLGYALFWLLAGLKAPGLASTGAAKESLRLLALPTSSLCMLGLIVVIVFSAKALFFTSQDAHSSTAPDDAN